MDDHAYFTYNCRDCVATFEIDEEEMKRAAKSPRALSVVEFQNSLIQPMARITRRGIRVDPKVWNDARINTYQESEDNYKWIEAALGHSINIDSPLQMKTLFYTDLAQQPVKVRKGPTWVVSCGAEAFPKIVEREPLLKPLVDRIEGIRSLKKDLDKLNAVLTEDGRLCCIYNIAGTITYRFSHVETAFGVGTNLGNLNKNIKRALVPDEGMTMFDADLDSADLSIVAWESECKELKEMLRGGIKVYVEIAKEYYHDPTFSKTLANGEENPMYRVFKSLCHGTNYMGQSAGLSSKTGLAKTEIDKVQKWYFGRFPEIKRWHERVIGEINNGFVQNIFGHRCYFLGRTTQDSYRKGIAWIPQSTVARIINTGLVRIDAAEQRGDFPVLLLNQVHDSLLGEYPTNMEEVLKPKILEMMRVELPYADPLTIPVQLHTSEESWAKCK